MVANIQEITIELLQRCYQNCKYCSSNSNRVQNIMLPFEKIIEIIDDFTILGGKIVELSGGEPLDYPYLSEVINYLKNKDIQIHFFTCCYHLKNEIDWDLIQKVDRVYVNLQAPNSELHDFLTNNPGSFDNVTDFIKKSKERGKWIGTHIIPLPYNIGEFDEYVELAKKMKLDNISLLRYVVQGRGSSSLKLSSEEILQLHSLITKYSKEKSIEVKYGCPLDFQFIYSRKQQVKPCLSGIERCVIRPNGNIIPCPAFKDTPSFVAGNIHERSLLDTWNNSELFNELRNFNENRLEGICEKCSFLSLCKGRCHAQRIHTHDNLYLGPDPYCPIFNTTKISKS